jgi:hypothetical protein
MKPGEIKVGTCYRSSKNEVRQVLEVTSEKRVIYKARNSAFKDGEAVWYQNSNPNMHPMLYIFASAVVGEVPCDWNSATTEAPLPSAPFFSVKIDKPAAAAKDPMDE